MILQRNKAHAYRVEACTVKGDPVMVLHEEDVKDLFGRDIYDALKGDKVVHCKVVLEATQ